MPRWIVLVILILLCGCGDDDFVPYTPPGKPEAKIVIHARGAEWDAFLDGQHLGRISWTQSYDVSAGSHTLTVQRSQGIATRADRADLSFVIGRGETVEFEAFVDGGGLSRLIRLE